MSNELTGIFGKQWKEGENPEELMMSQAIELDYHPGGVKKAAVKGILAHPLFPELQNIVRELYNLKELLPVLTPEELEERLAKYLTKEKPIYYTIESDVEKKWRIRPNNAEFRTALRFALKAKKGDRFQTALQTNSYFFGFH